MTDGLTASASRMCPGVLPIEQIGPDIHRHVAHVLGESFGLVQDKSLDGWCDQVMALPSLTTYAAFDGWDIVAVAALLVVGDSALLSGAATLPGSRGSGLYTAMVARRLEDAARLGVRSVFAEVEVGPQYADSTALRTLRSLGFTELSDPRDWGWRP